MTLLRVTRADSTRSRRVSDGVKILQWFHLTLLMLSRAARVVRTSRDPEWFRVELVDASSSMALRSVSIAACGQRLPFFFPCAGTAPLLDMVVDVPHRKSRVYVEMIVMFMYT